MSFNWVGFLMIHFQSRDQIIDWLIDNCLRPAIVRSLIDSKVEFLGGFKPIPPSVLPGWILKIISLHNKKWIVAVLANDIKHIYEIRIIKSVPWKNWLGTDSFTNHRTFRIKLFSGDRPELYKELRDGKNISL